MKQVQPSWWRQAFTQQSILSRQQGETKKGQGRRLRELWQLFKIMNKLSKALRLEMMEGTGWNSCLPFIQLTLYTTHQQVDIFFITQRLTLKYREAIVLLCQKKKKLYSLIHCVIIFTLVFTIWKVLSNISTWHH